jgi:hypothetical protein
VPAPVCFGHAQESPPISWQGVASLPTAFAISAASDTQDYKRLRPNSLDDQDVALVEPVVQLAKAGGDGGLDGRFYIALVEGAPATAHGSVDSVLGIYPRAFHGAP